MAEKEELSNLEIALFALHKQGGISKKVHTEYIAWEAFKLAPERFSWRLPEFRQRGFPDKTPVRYALELAKKAEHGSLVTGRAGGDSGGDESEGWTFTPSGAEWIKQNELRISEVLKQHVGELHPRELNRFLAKIRKENAYIFFATDGNLNRVSKYMFTDLLGCTPDASSEIIKSKFNRVLTIANFTEDSKVIEFLNQCSLVFSSLMEIKGGQK